MGRRRRRRSLLRIVHARGAIPNEEEEEFITSSNWRGKHNSGVEALSLYQWMILIA